jgi:hypothetical protein
VISLLSKNVLDVLNWNKFLNLITLLDGALVEGVGLLLDMLHLLYSSSSNTFGMLLEPCLEMFLLVLSQIWMLK